MSEKSGRINHEPAFLLTATPWRESSLWLEMFSRRYGRVALLGRSARKAQSELRGVLVPFVPISASWYGSQELKTLHRAEWLGGWRQPQGRSLFSGLYVNELMLKLTAREDPHPALYDALATVMREIAEQANHVAALRVFEWRLMQELGLAPDLQQDDNDTEIIGEQRYWLAPQQPVQTYSATIAETGVGMAVDGETLISLREGRFHSGNHLQQALQLNRLLIDFYLPQGIKSRQVLQQMQAFQTGIV